MRCLSSAPVCTAPSSRQLRPPSSSIAHGRAPPAQDENPAARAQRLARENRAMASFAREICDYRAPATSPWLGHQTCYHGVGHGLVHAQLVSDMMMRRAAGVAGGRVPLVVPKRESMRMDMATIEAAIAMSEAVDEFQGGTTGIFHHVFRYALRDVRPTGGRPRATR